MKPAVDKTPRIRGRALQRIRDRIRRRDGDLCQRCIREGRPAVMGLEVDHRLALDHGGEETDANRELLCGDCHQLKTREDMGYKPKGCDASGWPTDPRHPWNRRT